MERTDPPFTLLDEAAISAGELRRDPYDFCFVEHFGSSCEEIETRFAFSGHFGFLVGNLQRFQTIQCAMEYSKTILIIKIGRGS